MPEVRQLSCNGDDMLKILHGCFPGFAERYEEYVQKWDEFLDSGTGALKAFLDDASDRQNRRYGASLIVSERCPAVVRAREGRSSSCL